jgi:hypothetical protein
MELHADLVRGSEDAPLLGFILKIEVVPRREWSDALCAHIAQLDRSSV